MGQVGQKGISVLVELLDAPWDPSRYRDAYREQVLVQIAAEYFNRLGFRRFAQLRQ